MRRANLAWTVATDRARLLIDRQPGKLHPLMRGEALGVAPTAVDDYLAGAFDIGDIDLVLVESLAEGDWPRQTGRQSIAAQPAVRALDQHVAIEDHLPTVEA